MSKFDGTIEMAWLEDAVRDDLNKRAPRVMAVLRPLKVVIDELSRRPDRRTGRRQQSRRSERPARARCRSGRVLYIERDDFREDPPKEFFRLAPGKEVRLRWAYFIKCTASSRTRRRRRHRAALHLRPGHPRRQRPRWPQGEGDDPLGLRRACHAGRGAALRSSLQSAVPGRCARRRQTTWQSEPGLARSVAASMDRAEHCQWRGRFARAIRAARLFQRADAKDSKPGKLVFNRSVTLADTWAKLQKK